MTSQDSALTFRRATPEDATDLSALINSAFRSERTGQTWLYDSQDRRVDIVNTELISSFIQSANMVMLVGITATTSKPVVTCYLRQPSDPTDAHMTPGAAWLGFLAVSPECHRQGYGLAMMQEAERFVVQEWHHGRLEIDFVNTRAELRRWYEKHGYCATGARRDFPYGQNGRDILADGLEMVVLGKDLKES